MRNRRLIVLVVSFGGDDGMIQSASGILQSGRDVGILEVGIVLQDLLPISTGRKQVEDVLNANAQAPDGWATTAKALLGVIRWSSFMAALAFPLRGFVAIGALRCANSWAECDRPCGRRGNWH